VDVQSKAEIYALIDTLARNGKAILLVSSYLPELIGVSDRMAVMYRGRLSAPRPAEEIDEEQLLTACTMSAEASA
jgi:ribose transport system ATP-binding protein